MSAVGLNLAANNMTGARPALVSLLAVADGLDQAATSRCRIPGTRLLRPPG